MTNTQKALEIAKVHEVHYDRFHGETSNDECFLSALEMAEWKDEQHAEEKRQWIDKACEWLEEFTMDYVNDTKLGFSKKEFVKDFREAMKDEQDTAKEDKESILTKKNKELLLKDLCSKLPYGGDFLK